jgi:hypothetical protein
VITVARFGLAFFALASCKAFDESLLDAAFDARPICSPRVPPPAPAPSGVDGEPVVFALRDVTFEQSAPFDIAYDLDGFCSAEPDRMAECTAPSGADFETDGPDGTDNVVGRVVIPSIVVFHGPVDEPLRANQRLGLGTVLLRVEGWNGEDDDDRVSVTFAGGAFGTPPLADGSMPPTPMPGEIPPPPAWDGRDFFWARSSDFAGDASSPLHRDDAAYVADRVLVAHPPDETPFAFTAADASLEVVLSGATLTAAIAGDSSGLSNVILAGRWRGTDLVRTMEPYGICMATPEHDRVLLLLEQNADLLVEPGTGGECVALSTGIGFTGHRVAWAGLAKEPTPPAGCP